LLRRKSVALVEKEAIPDGALVRPYVMEWSYSAPAHESTPPPANAKTALSAMRGAALASETSWRDYTASSVSRKP